MVLLAALVLFVVPFINHPRTPKPQFPYRITAYHKLTVTIV